MKPQTFLYPHITPQLRAELRELHEDTLPADVMPDFRRESAAVLRVGETPVAYVTWRMNRVYPILDRIGVIEEWRGRGLSGRLLDVALKHAPREWRTYIAVHNIPSQRLFISRGFSPYSFFTDGETQFIRYSKKGVTK